MGRRKKNPKNNVLNFRQCFFQLAHTLRRSNFCTLLCSSENCQVPLYGRLYNNGSSSSYDSAIRCRVFLKKHTLNIRLHRKRLRSTGFLLNNTVNVWLFRSLTGRVTDVEPILAERNQQRQHYLLSYTFHPRLNAFIVPLQDTVTDIVVRIIN